MIPDPTAEIKRIRHQLGADANFDLGRIFADLRRQQENSHRTYVRLPHRKPSDTNPLQRSGESSVVEVDNLSSPPADIKGVTDIKGVKPL